MNCINNVPDEIDTNFRATQDFIKGLAQKFDYRYNNLLMQPRESIKTISYLGKTISKNTRRQNKELTWGFFYWSSKSPPRDLYVSVEEVWVAHQEPAPSRVSFNCFLPLLALASFLTEVKRTFTNFPMAHHNFGSSWAMPGHLGGTSKSNKCYEDCFTKLKCSQRISHSTLTWISHKSYKPH
jgi:hypothetical protein